MLYMYKLSNLLQCELFVNKVREYRRDNPQKLATQGTQDEGTIQRNCQHRVHKTKGQSRETANIGYTRRRDNPEKLPTYGTQDQRYILIYLKTYVSSNTNICDKDIFITNRNNILYKVQDYRTQFSLQQCCSHNNM